MSGNSEAMQAAKVAKRRLQDLYPEAYERVLIEERTKRGLSPLPVPNGKSATYLMDRLEKLREREARIVAELKDRGVEVERDS